MRRVLCWLLWLFTFSLLGHRWHVVRASRPGYQREIHPLAGCDALCLRCGARWEDSGSGHAIEEDPGPLTLELDGSPSDFVQLPTPEPHGGWLETRPGREEF